MTITMTAAETTIATGIQGAILFSNDDAKINETNYWTSQYAKHGLCYLSGNAGDWRLLIPAANGEAIHEFGSVRRASIEPSIILAGCMDVIAEDGTSSPYCISLDKKMIARKLTRKRCRLLIYTDYGLVNNVPVQVRP